MQALIIINPQDARQLAMKERIRAELGTHIETVKIAELTDEIKAAYRIRALPAIIFAPEHLQGTHLLNETESGGTLGITAEVLSAFEKEEQALFDPSSNRVGLYVEKQVKDGQDALLEEIIGRGILA